MTAFIFVGPTLREDDRARNWDVTYLPPVEQGQIEALVERKPTAIGIIDGRFHDVPSVWHKEILWALHAGIRVYGSASMGALRAAELTDFGMRGVGTVYEMYRKGVLEDDDEVTVAHTGPEDGHIQVSDAMVNIRATLDLAHEEGLIQDSTRLKLLHLNKRQFYAQRNLLLTLREALSEGAPVNEIGALRELLRNGMVDQKKTDAIAMIERMKREGSFETPADDVGFTFEHNAFFDRARNNGLTYNGTFMRITQILNEVRLQPSVYLRLRRQALGYVTPRLDPLWRKRHIDTSFAVARLCRTYNLASDAEWGRWLKSHGCTKDRAEAILRDEIRSQEYRPYGGGINGYLIDAMKVDGLLEKVALRAEAKRHFLEERGLSDPAGGGLGITADADILAWYFDSIGAQRPENMYRYAVSLDFQGGFEFLKSVREEFHFRNSAQDCGPASVYAVADDECVEQLRRAVWQESWMPAG